MEAKRPNILCSLLVNIAYALAAVVAWPYYLFLLATRKKYRSHVRERWGFVPKRKLGLKQRFWVHCISVGEVEAARTFIPALAEAYPGAEIVLSTTTMTGRRRARARFGDLSVFHFPIDLWPCVRRALKRVKPSAVIQVESEWWPNFFFMAARRNIPVVCVNVRITERSARRYRHIRPVMRATFNACAAIGVQAELYRDRFVALGADGDRIRITGQMKHDGVTFADTVEGAEDLAREMKIEPGEPVLVAGSTGPGEEQTLLAAYQQVRRMYPRLRLVIVPRRPENFDAAAESVLAAGLGVVRRSRTTEWQGSKLLPPVILHTMGELMKWYALADIVFLGRSLSALGGSNPMEPGSLAKPLLWGPQMFNFPVEAPALVEAGAARQVAGAEELADAIADLLTHPDRRRQMGQAARRTIRKMQGATARTIDLVRQTLSSAE